MNRLRVGIIGAGMTGTLHAEAARRIPGVEVAAIADRDIETAGAMANRLMIGEAYGDYHRMLEECALDVVHNCTPNSLHAEISRHAMELGVAVYSEKPLAATVAQGRQLAELAAQKSIPCGVNFQYRGNAMVQEMRARLCGGDAGRPFLVHGRYLQDWLLYDTDYNWRIDEAEAQGTRAVADIGSHWFDLAQFVTGSPVTAVFAHLVNVHKTRRKPEAPILTFQQAGEVPLEEVAVSSEDAGFILMKFSCGAQGMLLLSQVSAGYKNALELEIDCERYSMTWRQEVADRLSLGYREGGNRLLHADPGTLSGPAKRFALLPAGHSVAWNDALRNNMAEFYGTVRGGGAMSTCASFGEAWQVMELVEACRESAAKGVWINIT